VEGSSEHGNELSGSIKRWEIAEELSDWRLLKNKSDHWGYLYAEAVSELGRLENVSPSQMSWFELI
jgi:hypothetical protein